MKSALGASVAQMALPWALRPLETSTSDRPAMTQRTILRDACCSSQAHHKPHGVWAKASCFPG